MRPFGCNSSSSVQKTEPSITPSELAGRCAATAEKTRRNMAAIEEAFYRALLRGKKEGELKGVREPRAMARFLYNSFQGLVLMSKATQDRKTLDDIVKVTLSVLD